MAPTVAVLGGGYGGISVAKALDDIADVVLVEPRETFVHNVAALRAAVDPDWTERIFIPYDGLLSRGRVLRDRAVRVHPTAVDLGSGRRFTADYLVLATGSTSPYPSKLDVEEAAGAAAKLRSTQAALARADRVLLLGAGPIGIEFAGEIKAVWPDKTVTVVDPAADLVSGRFPDAFRAELRAQLDELGVELLLGTSLRELPETGPGQTGGFTVTTRSGVEIDADIWFPCYGGTVDSDYLGPELRPARRPDGRLAVTAELRLPGQETVFAVGDVTAVPEMKQARAAQQHAEVVAANVRTLIEGGGTLATYRAAADSIVLPVGPKGGVGYHPEAGLLGAVPTAELKGGLFLDRYLELLGAVAAR
ncbi:NAD(P)/FAD-dependent oxidoreductase [Plantactinospora mayteni]|uniref:NADH dehydrogenase n=1 Tax=Plantactinospora mayteni TaxID=566021 RepID=A0ABQ4EWW9_9ACTN|nr:FAD-dependent oxidoreductase [Plantactinospora mayteni]GIG99109.1 NADH dehydrogenase [Plantactinospora mayteni]